MMGLASEVDVAVIGAGAAGIAAARRLVAAGRVSVQVLVASKRAFHRPPGTRTEAAGASSGPCAARWTAQ